MKAHCQTLRDASCAGCRTDRHEDAPTVRGNPGCRAGWTPYGFAVCKDGKQKQLSEQFRSKSDNNRFDYSGHDYYHHDTYYNCYYYNH